MNLGKETETLEFKKTTGEIKESMKSISSMLNKHGIGTVYYGVARDGEVCGQDVSEQSLRDVSRAIYQNIRPQIYPAITEKLLDGKHVIKVEFNGDDVPYSADGRYYSRVADEDLEVTPEQLREMFVANAYKDRWENTESEATSQQIDRAAINQFWQKAVSVGRMPQGNYTCPAILKKFGLVNGDHLNNAGEYLFGNTHPVTLKAAIFATNEKLTFIDMKVFEDNIYNLLEIAEDYIMKNIRWRADIIGTEREEIPEIPVPVIREALANSFAHAQYDGRTTHEICIHPGMVTIYSPGRYASAHQPEEYAKKNLESVIRNEKIAKMLYLNHSIEQFGSGFRRISSYCKDAGLKYSYEMDDYGFKFIIYRKKFQSDIQSDIRSDISNVTLNDTEKSILKILKHDPATSRDEMAERVSRTVRTVQRTLDSLRKKGYIQREGSKSNPRWTVLK